MELNMDMEYDEHMFETLGIVQLACKHAKNFFSETH